MSPILETVSEFATEPSIALFRLIARLDAGSDREGSRPKHAENKSAVRLRPEHYGPFLSVLARSPRGAAPLDLRLPLEAKPDPVRARFAAKPRCGGQTGNEIGGRIRAVGKIADPGGY